MKGVFAKGPYAGLWTDVGAADAGGTWTSLKRRLIRLTHGPPCVNLIRSPMLSVTINVGSFNNYGYGNRTCAYSQVPKPDTQR